MKSQKYVCVYKDQPTESYYTDEDMFVALDSHSGGYPTRVSIHRVHTFKTEEECKKYASHFQNEMYPAIVTIDIQFTKL